MPKAKQTRTRKRVAFARLLMQRGSSRREVMHELQREFDVCRKAAWMTMKCADTEMEQELKAKRHVLTSRQFAKLQHAQRLALNAKRGPDLGALIAILREQNRLLGLYAGVEIGESGATLPFVLMERGESPSQQQQDTNGTSPHTQSPSLNPYSQRNGDS